MRSRRSRDSGFHRAIPTALEAGPIDDPDSLIPDTTGDLAVRIVRESAEFSPILTALQRILAQKLRAAIPKVVDSGAFPTLRKS